jgi:hypothetical protein
MVPNPERSEGMLSSTCEEWRNIELNNRNLSARIPSLPLRVPYLSPASEGRRHVESMIPSLPLRVLYLSLSLSFALSLIHDR